ncbi:MAG: hypothetical protein ACLQRH_12840, partial [Acidimicrobiales bacterium]
MGICVQHFGSQSESRRLAYKPRYGVTSSRLLADTMPYPQHAQVGLPREAVGNFNKIYKCDHVGPGHVAGVNYEDTRLEEAITSAYTVARDRLRAEAVDLSAHGVVGARLELRHLPLVAASGPTHELRLVGTAVTSPATDHVEQPFICHLSGQAVAKLVDAGWVPVDTVIGCG